ncbi:hypothetical protein GCM10008942_25120 [Rhizomicrobium electricum]|uniref:Secreted protein n=1 Tax=Rhizomicrobium electricum TaxID=480070 RepID=A0ABP3PTI0_9PROT
MLSGEADDDVLAVAAAMMAATTVGFWGAAGIWGCGTLKSAAVLRASVCAEVLPVPVWIWPEGISTAAGAAEPGWESWSVALCNMLAAIKDGM